MWLLYLLGLAGLNELASIDNKLAKSKSQIDPQNDPRTCRFVKMNDGKGHQFMIDQNNINVTARLNRTWCNCWKAFFVFVSCVALSSIVVFIMDLKGKLPLDPYTKLTDAAFRNLLICIFTIGALITFFIVRSGLKYAKKQGRVSFPDLGVWCLLLSVWGSTLYYALLK